MQCRPCLGSTVLKCMSAESPFIGGAVSVALIFVEPNQTNRTIRLLLRVRFGLLLNFPETYFEYWLPLKWLRVGYATAQYFLFVPYAGWSLLPVSVCS